MKKVFALVMILCIALSISACNNDEETNSTTVSTNVSTTESTTVTTTEEETTQSTNPFDYIKKPSDLLNDLNPLLLKKGCNIDNYVDYSNDDFEIRLIGNGERQMVMIHNSSYYTESADIICFGPSTTLLIANNKLAVTGSNELFVGDVFDTVLKECPYEYKYDSYQMRSLFDDYCFNVNNGKRATWTIDNYEFAVSKGYNSNGVIDSVMYSINW